MSRRRSIIIHGGGLAGLSLGVALRQRGIPVTIFEAGRYPRHRVCGEFISGRGQQVLVRLGLHDALLAAGAIPAKTARFFIGRTHSPARALTPPALSVSRFTLDTLLAAEFREHGGDLRENTRASEMDGAEGVVHAVGRRLRPVEQGWRWFGMKIHARAARLSADLEMHGVPNGYVGMSRLPDGEVNICGLFRRRTKAPDSATTWRDALRGSPGTPLREHLDGAEFDEHSFCSVAGLSLRAERAADCSDCRIGDALTMIPPVTGNGMSMAFEAAELAATPLAAYSGGECGWREAQRAVACACDEAFARRLAWARWLQWLMFSPVLRSPLGRMLLRSEWVWGLLFAGTR